MQFLLVETAKTENSRCIVEQIMINREGVTSGMLQAGFAAYHEIMNGVEPNEFDAIAAAFKAMSEAAPKPPPPGRAEFERLIKAQTPTAQLTRAENGEYIVHVIQTMWEGYCMAMPEVQGEVVVTADESGRAVAVTRQDAEGQILSVIWEAPPAQEADPVLWLCEFDDRTWYVTIKEGADRYAADGATVVPLYTRPANDKLRQIAWHAVDALEALNERTVSAHLRAALEGKS